MSMYNNIYEILGEYSYIPPQISGNRPHAPPKFSGYASRPTGWGDSESTVSVLPSTAVFFTVLTVAHSRWYRPTLAMILESCFLFAI